MNETLLIFLSSVAFASLLILCVYIRLNFKHKNKTIILDNYAVLDAIYRHAVEAAYKNVYRSDILPRFSSGYVLDDDMFNKVCKKFINLVMMYMGKNVLKDLVLVYGNLESIVTYFTNEFKLKVEDDAVLVKGVNNQLQDEES